MNIDNSLPSDSDPTTLKSLESLLQQILNVLQNSTIADERGQDVLSKFWAAYKRVSGEYDNDMLERCNGNMDIVLIFAGLFSAVNTAFIIAMQPDPVDTTNTLLVQLIQTLDGSSTVQPITLSTAAPTGYPSAYVWAQALAYASLAFSLLAAFGAVLGKQWLGYYKTSRYGPGSLEARCKQRHRKFRKLQDWQLGNILHSFPVLLEISLLLFSLSLGAAMWTQHQAISIIIIATTGLGVLCHIVTIAISAISLDCPFQSSISLAIQVIIRYFRKSGGLPASISLVIQAIIRQLGGSWSPVSLAIQTLIRYFRDSGSFWSPALTAIQARIRYFHKSGHSQPADNDDPTTSAMQWILETSTNPDVVMSVVELMRTMPEQPKVNIVSLCGEVGEMFKSCFDLGGHTVHEDRALDYGQALIHFSWNQPKEKEEMLPDSREWNVWGSWRALYLPWALKRCFILYDEMEGRDDLRKNAQAHLRNALRKIVTIGVDGFTYSDDERLIWDGQFQLHFFGSHSVSEEDRQKFISQLLKYVQHFHGIGDFEVAGDALLIASGITTTPKARPFSDPGLFSNSLVALNLVHSTITSLPLTTIHPRWGSVVLGVVRRFLNCDVYSNFHAIASQAVLTALCSPADHIQIPDDQYRVWFTNAAQLFSLTCWSEGHHLKHSPLPKIQDLVLLALRRLPKPKVGNAAKYIPYCSALSRLMCPGNHPDLRLLALRTASNDRQELALIDAAGFDSSQQDAVLSELSPALLTVALDNSVHKEDLTVYFHLVATLARNPRWSSRLNMDGHGDGCLALITVDLCEEACFYLAQFFFWIASPTQSIPYGTMKNEQRWHLTKMAWRFIGRSDSQIDDVMDIIPSLVKSTEMSVSQNFSKDDPRLFSDCMGNVIQRLQQEHWPSTVISEVTKLKDTVENRLNQT